MQMVETKLIPICRRHEPITVKTNKTLLGLLNTSAMKHYRFNTKNSGTFLYCKLSGSGGIKKKTISCWLWKIKHLGTNMTIKTTAFEENSRRWEDFLCSWNGRINTVKNDCLLSWLLIIHLHRHNKHNFKNYKCNHHAITNLHGSIHGSFIWTDGQNWKSRYFSGISNQTFCKVTFIQAIWYWLKTETHKSKE